MIRPSEADGPSAIATALVEHFSINTGFIDESGNVHVDLGFVTITERDVITNALRMYALAWKHAW